MSNDFRPIRGPDRTPFQQSLAIDRSDYVHYQMTQTMLGVILEVHPSDTDQNRSAQQSLERRGYLHECSVLVVNANSSSNLILDHVTITPDGSCGLDHYFEHLPRGSSNLTTGGEFSTSLAGIDPYTLDGDWCVIGFLGANLDQPFVLRWWPHPRNALDPMTSAHGNPNRNGDAQALDQQGRMFQRINGVEYVVTKEGDIFLSTKYANSRLTFQQDQEVTQGRWPRNLDEENGGSILVQVKPSQTLELAWDSAREGVGFRNRVDDQLPQPNPRPRNSTTESQQREKTYVYMDKERARILTPEEVKLSTKEILCEADTSFTVDSDDSVSISATNSATIDSTAINLGSNASDFVLKGSSYNTQLSIFLTAVQTFCTTISSADSTLAPAASALQLAAQAFQLQLDSLLSTKVKTE